jgi:hypothetical protein
VVLLLEWGQGTITSYHENKTEFNERLREVSNLDRLSGTRYRTKNRYENMEWQDSLQIRITGNKYLKMCRLDVAGVAQGQLAGFCEDGNGSSASSKCWKILTSPLSSSRVIPLMIYLVV